MDAIQNAIVVIQNAFRCDYIQNTLCAAVGYQIVKLSYTVLSITTTVSYLTYLLYCTTNLTGYVATMVSQIK